jgi:peptidoglycan/xylan/chitin deacetylase (PgdA/CDA1 family)
MPDSYKSSSTKAATRTKTWRAVLLVGLFVLLGVVPVAVATTLPENPEPPTIVIRIDDIQDYAFKEAQLFLLDESQTHKVPVSLAVIAGMFGEDREVVQKVKLSVRSGSEVAVHGWKHEDLAKLSYEDQVQTLAESRRRIKEILDVDTDILIPPMFSFSEDTVAAMRQEGYKIISTITEYVEPGSIRGVVMLPATVELSDYANGIWKMKSLGSVLAEVSNSVRQYGYAVIVTHPQEFTEDETLNKANVELYRDMIMTLKDSYSFGTLESISKKWQRTG